MATVKWIKIVTDIFDDEKMLLIESLPSADSIIVVWFKLLCLAGKNNNSGVFMLNERIAYTDEMLATIFRKDVNTVRFALKTFADFGMIEIIDNVITIPNWGKHQTLDAYEKRKERDRIYQKEKRAKQKLLIKSSDESAEKSSDVVALEEEKEKEEDKNKNNKKKKKSEFDIFIEEYTENLKLKETIYEFIKMRKAIKAPMTSNALKLMLRKLDNISNNDDEKIEIINNSILNSWKGIFPLKSTDSEYGGNSRNDKGRSKSDGNSGVTSNNNREKSDEWVGL
ncbi:phage replisome organizer N-terminal domain-containing protein [Clostridium disporicum]|jgi:predicted phage replisome organizer|uniref:phage replisome organizer N-terminal domain-containing protein n=2 Tax=Clostridium TaxID=1485 RepID=UPI00321B34C1